MILAVVQLLFVGFYFIQSSYVSHKIVAGAVFRLNNFISKKPLKMFGNFLNIFCCKMALSSPKINSLFFVKK